MQPGGGGSLRSREFGVVQENLPCRIGTNFVLLKFSISIVSLGEHQRPLSDFRRACSHAKLEMLSLPKATHESVGRVVTAVKRTNVHMSIKCAAGDRIRCLCASTHADGGTGRHRHTHTHTHRQRHTHTHTHTFGFTHDMTEVIYRVSKLKSSSHFPFAHFRSYPTLHSGQTLSKDFSEGVITSATVEATTLRV